MTTGQSNGVVPSWIHSNEVFHIISFQDENTAVVDLAARFGRWLWLRTVDVLADEFLVAESCFLLLGAIFADAFGCETRPTGEESTVNRFYPRGYRQKAASAVQVVDERGD